jgi:hypothetical protein
MKYRTAVLVLATLFSPAASAELLDITKVNDGNNINAPAGTIAKSLQQQVGAGHGNVLTPGSAVYLVKRDPARSVRRGRQLFQRKFSADEGLGPRVNFDSSGDVTVNRALGAGLADSCALCHGRPRGSAGFGGDVVTRPDSRDAPHLFGLGLAEQLADEMTYDLRVIRDQAVAAAVGGAVCDSTPTNAAEWRVNTAYAINARVSFHSKEYRAVQAHTSEGDWEPPNVPALWAKVTPTGTCFWDTQVAYAIGNRVQFGNNIYQAIQAHTSQKGWEPPNVSSLWSRLTTSTTVTRTLTAKGVGFGSITVRNAVIENTGVRGVNADLRIRPFFAQGGTVSMREFTNGAFNDEMGLQAVDPVLCAVTDPANPRTQVSPAGFVFDPIRDTFERPKACATNADPDADGKTNEIDTALVDHMEFYLLNYFKPGRYEVTQRAQEGLALMNQIGCTSCHVQDLTVNRDRRVADLETVYDPPRGIFNDLFSTAATLFTVVPDGEAFPLLVPNRQQFVVRNFFSDLKRHDLGAEFHEREYNGTLVREFVTEPLWGVGTTAPYGHDGRSINLDQVIRRHGGEAQSIKQAYVALTSDNKLKVQEFLQTLVLFPPDDTASTLNPGNPATTNPQDPAQHGSINLGALFQIPSEGPE